MISRGGFPRDPLSDPFPCRYVAGGTTGVGRFLKEISVIVSMAHFGHDFAPRPASRFKSWDFL